MSKLRTLVRIAVGLAPLLLVLGSLMPKTAGLRAFAAEHCGKARWKL